MDIFGNIGSFIIENGFQGILVVMVLILGFFLYKQISKTLNGDLVPKSRLEEVRTDSLAEINRNTASYMVVIENQKAQISDSTALLKDVKESRDELEKAVTAQAQENLELVKHLVKDIDQVQKKIEADNDDSKPAGSG